MRGFEGVAALHLPHRHSCRKARLDGAPTTPSPVFRRFCVRDRRKMKSLAGIVCVALLVACGSNAPEGSFVQNERGVVVTPADGKQRRVRLEVRDDRIVRVTAVADGNLELPASLMVVEAA